MSDDAIRIAVVGHTNAGKTSLLRTLTRRVRFGEVSERPGTTRHVEQVVLEIDGRVAVTFLDTPGLEDSVNLREHLHLVALADVTPPDRIRAFLKGPEAHGQFEQEAKVLRAMFEVDAAFLVIDAREAVLPKFRAELELLGSCARPVLPVLNFVRDPRNREADWRQVLSAYGLHSVVRFDAVAPFVGAERELYQDLGTLLGQRRRQLQDIARALALEADQRRAATALRIAELAVDVAAMRRTVPPGPPSVSRESGQLGQTGGSSPSSPSGPSGNAAARQTQLAELRAAVAASAQRCTDDLLALYGFREGDADEAPLPQLAGRWSMDFFSPEAVREAGLRLGKGAAIGAAVGVVADIALAGLSLGAATAIGASIGGALSQGLGPTGRKLANLLNKVQELTVEDAVLQVLLAWQLALVQALERRGHGATSRINAVAPGTAVPTDAADAADATTAPQVTHAADAADAANAASAAVPSVAAFRHDLQAVIRAVRPARGHPEWQAGLRSRWLAEPRREALVNEVAQVLRPMVAGVPGEPGIAVPAGRS